MPTNQTPAQTSGAGETIGAGLDGDIPVGVPLAQIARVAGSEILRTLADDEIVVSPDGTYTSYYIGHMSVGDVTGYMELRVKRNPEDNGTKAEREPENPVIISMGGRLEMDTVGRVATLDDKLITLTRKEFDLLEFFAKNPGVVFSREDLLEGVWNSTAAWLGKSTVTEHVRKVRIKIDEDQDTKNPHIITLRGVGYKFRSGMEEDEVQTVTRQLTSRFLH